MSPNAKKGVIDLFSDASSIPDQLVQIAGLDVAYGIEPTEVHGFQDLFGEWLPETRDARPSNASCDSSTSSQLPLEMLENDIYQSVIGEICSTRYDSNALDGELSSTPQVSVGSHQSKSAESYVLGGSVASLSRKTSKNHQSSVRDHTAKVSVSTVPVIGFSGFGPRDCDGIHISSCGHAVHQECHDRYLTSLKQR